jgi:hypothetical protein
MFFGPTFSSFHSFAETTVPSLIFLEPLVKVKSVKTDTLRADWYFNQMWAYLRVESIFVHAQIGWGVAKADHSWLYLAARAGIFAGCEGDWGCFVVVTLMVLTAHVVPSLFAIHS